MAVSVGVGVGVSVGLGVGVAVSVGVGEGVAEALGETVPRLRVVATAARITVVSPLAGVGAATGWRSADGLTLICGVGVWSAATGKGWAAAWRAPKYTMVNRPTSTMRARLAATSVGANMDLIESHRPFPRMASVPPYEPSLVGPF